MPVPAGYGNKYRFTATAPGYSGGARVTLYKSGYAPGGGDPSAVTPSGRGGLRATFDPDADTPEEVRLWTGSLEFPLHDASAALSQELATAGVRGFVALLELDDGGGFDEALVTWVKPGFAERGRTKYGGETTLSAFCGLSELQDVYYEELHGHDPRDASYDVALAADALRLASRRSVISEVCRILAQTGFALPVRAVQNWSYFGSAAAAVGRNLEAVECDPYVYRPDEDRSWTCDTVLRDLLGSHQLRCFQWAGAWWLVQWEHQEAAVRAGSALTYYEYAADYHTALLAPTSSTYTPGLVLPTGDSLFLARDGGGGRGYVLPPLGTATIAYEHGALSGDLLSNPGFEGAYTGGIARDWARSGTPVVTMQEDPAISEGKSSQFMGSIQNTGTNPLDKSAAYVLAGTNGTGDSTFLAGRTLAAGGTLSASIDVYSYGDRSRFAFFEVKVGSNWLTAAGAWSGSAVAIGRQVAGGTAETLSVTGVDAIPTQGAILVKVYAGVEAHSAVPAAGVGLRWDNLKFDHKPNGDKEDERTYTTAASGEAGEARPAFSIYVGDGPQVDTPGCLLTPAGAQIGNWGRGAVGSATGTKLHELHTESLLDLRRTRRDAVEETYHIGGPGVAAACLPYHVPYMEDEATTLRPYGLLRLEWIVDTGDFTITAHEMYRETGTVAYNDRAVESKDGIGGGNTGAHTGGTTAALASYDYLRSDSWDGTVDGTGNVTAFATSAGFIITGQGHVDLFDGTSYIRIGSAQPLKIVSSDGADAVTTIEEGVVTVANSTETTTISGPVLVEAVSGASMELASGSLTASPDGIVFNEIIDGVNGDVKAPRDVTAGRALNVGVPAAPSTTTGDIVAKNKIKSEGEVEIDGALNHDGTTAGFYAAAPVTQPASANQTALGGVTQAAITDSSGGAASTTIAAATNTDALTDSTGGTANTTLAAVGATNAGDVSGAINDNFADLAAQLVKQRALNTVLTNAVASLAAELNKARTDETNNRTLTNQLRSDLVSLGLIKGSA
jgi:hypothetical protein